MMQAHTSPTYDAGVKRYVIIGAGAIGGTIGGRLAQHGHEVVLVARGANADAIERQGLLLRTPDGDHRVRPQVWRDVSDADVRPDDVLVLATKTQDAEAALRPWAFAELGDGRVAAEALPVLVCLNGVTAEDVALRWFTRVYGVCVWAPCSYLEPGIVIASGEGDSGVFHCGRVPAALTDDADRDLLSTIARDWNASRLRVELPTDVMPWKYRKLLSNVGNAFDALLGGAAHGSDLVDRARDEARAVLAAAGVDVLDEQVEESARAAGPKPVQIAGVPRSGSSSWQSLARGTGSIETDYLNGEIVRLAHRHGVPAPLNARISVLAARAVREGIQPGSVTQTELRSQLGLG